MMLTFWSTYATDQRADRFAQITIVRLELCLKTSPFPTLPQGASGKLVHGYFVWDRAS